MTSNTSQDKRDMTEGEEEIAKGLNDFFEKEKSQENWQTEIRKNNPETGIYHIDGPEYNVDEDKLIDFISQYFVLRAEVEEYIERNTTRNTIQVGTGNEVKVRISAKDKLHNKFLQDLKQALLQ